MNGDQEMPSSAAPGEADVERLRALVHRHEVCWETRPENAVVGGRIQPVGFLVEVSATHHEPHRTPVAGCAECSEPLLALQQILAFALPQGEHASIYEARVRWGTLQFSPRRGNRPEVVGSLAILHGSGANRPIDPCETSCRDEIVARLKQLGACEGAWHRS
jgi:hypothetical protein